MANGTIAFDTLSTSGQITGTAKSLDTDYVVNGSAKMWCTHSQASSYTLDDSFNVASIADNGAGETTINFTNAPANANYAVNITSGHANQRTIFNSNNIPVYLSKLFFSDIFPPIRIYRCKCR